MATDEQGSKSAAEDFETVELAAPRRGRRPKVKHEETVEASAPRRAPREPKARHAVVDAPPTDGFRDPLRVSCDPKLKPVWVTAEDRSRHFDRQWIPAKVGDSSLKLSFIPNGKKGEEIRYRELTLMLVDRKAEERRQANDPNRLQHQALHQRIVAVAEGSVGPNGERGYLKSNTVGVSMPALGG